MNTLLRPSQFCSPAHTCLHVRVYGSCDNTPQNERSVVSNAGYAWQACWQVAAGLQGCSANRATERNGLIFVLWWAAAAAARWHVECQRLELHWPDREQLPQ